MGRSGNDMAGRLIFGGSFNPLHIGHLRLALGALDLMPEIINIVEFMPSASPPHKQCAPMLPFSLRTEMIRASIKGSRCLMCNEMEASMATPSYTYDTLTILSQKYGKENIFFLLGSEDFALLPEWRNGLELTKLGSLVIAPRGDYSEKDFDRQSRAFWPGCRELLERPKDECLGVQIFSIGLPGGTSLYLLPLPHLAISATGIRKLWLCGKNLDYLVPAPALRILSGNRQLVAACWQEKPCSK